MGPLRRPPGAEDWFWEEVPLFPVHHLRFLSWCLRRGWMGTWAFCLDIQNLEG